MQTKIASIATLKEANHAELLWAHRVVMCHQSRTDPALVLTGSSNLCLMIVKLQGSLP